MDLFIEKGYPYTFNLDMNNTDGADLEGDYYCYFECSSIGKLQFGVANNRYELEISEVNTNKLVNNLEEYVVYVVKKSNSKPEKLLTGRIHVDEKVRA